MSTIKNKDVVVYVSDEKTDVGLLSYDLYNTDTNSASIRFFLKKEYDKRTGQYEPLNLEYEKLEPSMTIYCDDGTVLPQQPVKIITPKTGVVQYIFTEEVLCHLGEIEGHLHLVNQLNNYDAHVVKFRTYIKNSDGSFPRRRTITDAEIEDIVWNYMKKNSKELLSFAPSIPTDDNNKPDPKPQPDPQPTPPPTIIGESKSRLDGLTGVMIGDSITEHNFRAKFNYHDYIAKRTGLRVINMGISGTGYQDRRNVAYAVPEQPDFFSVFLGTNDWGLVGTKLRKLGDPNNIERGTVVSNIYYLLKQLTERYPFTPVVVMTPLPRVECNPNNEVPNKAGYTLGELVDAIKIIAHSFSLPVLDLYHNSNFKVWDYTVNKELYAAEPGKEDGLHPNAEGHEMMSFMIQSFYEQFAVVKPKIPYTLNRPDTQTLENGAKVTYAIPYDIFWKKNQSMIMNFKKTEINLDDMKVLKIESYDGSLINADNVAVNSPYWITNTQFEDGSQYNRTSEVQEFMDTLEQVDYTSGRGYEYLPQLFKITYIDSKSPIKGSYSSNDGFERIESSYNPDIDVDSPTYITPKSDKPDEKLDDGSIATYLYPKRIFWIKNQSLAINIDPFDFDTEEVYITDVQYKGQSAGLPNSTSANTPAYFQLNDYEDGSQYNRLSDIKNFTKGLPIKTETEKRIDYEQVELRIVYQKDRPKINLGGSTNTKVEPATITKNSDDTSTAVFKPTGIYWHPDQSFMVNVDTRQVDLTDKKVLKVKYAGKELVKPSIMIDNSPAWYTVKDQTGNNYDRRSEVQDFVSVLEKESTGVDGRIKYKGVEIEIIFAGSDYGIVKEVESSTAPVEIVENSDGTSTATLTPTKISWKQDQSFMLNYNKEALDLTGKTVVKIENEGQSLGQANFAASNYLYYLTVPTLQDGTANNHTTEINNFVKSLTVKNTEPDGRIVYANTPLKITFK